MIKLTFFISIALIGVQTVLAQRNDVRKLVKDAFASNDQIQAVSHLDQAYQEDTEDFVEELAFIIFNDEEKARTALPLLSTLIKRHPDDKNLAELQKEKQEREKLNEKRFMPYRVRIALR